MQSTVKILDIDFSIKNLKETVDFFENHIENNMELFHLVTVNPEICMLAQYDDELKSIRELCSQARKANINIKHSYLCKKREEINQKYH